MRLLADNLGIVTIYDKPSAIPADLEVKMSLASGIGPDGDVTTLSIFTTEFKEDQKSQFQVKQDLNNNIHILPFGAAPTMLMISGVTFSVSQVPTTGAPLLDSEYELITSKAERSYWEDAPLETNAPKEVDPPPEWLTKLNDARESVTDTVTGWVENAQGVIADIQDRVSTAIDTVMDLPGVAFVAGIVGFFTGPPDAAQLEHKKLTIENSDPPLSFPELHAVFKYLQAGSKSRASANNYISLSMAGVEYTCSIRSISYTALKNNSGFNFVMQLICHNSETYARPVTAETVDTREGRNAVSQIGEGLGQVISAAVTSGGVSLGGFI